MSAVLTLFVLALAAPAEATPPPAPAASHSRSGVVQPPENDNIADDVAESFQDLLNGGHDENIRQMVVFRIKQGRCEDARQLAAEEGKPDLASLVARTCKPAQK